MSDLWFFSLKVFEFFCGSGVTPCAGDRTVTGTAGVKVTQSSVWSFHVGRIHPLCRLMSDSSVRSGLVQITLNETKSLARGASLGGECFSTAFLRVSGFNYRVKRRRASVK